MLAPKSQKESQTPSQSKKSEGFFFQPKLTINQPNDVYEQEADAVADKVMRMPERSPFLGNNKPFFSPPTVNINKKVAPKEELQKKENKEETEEPLPEIQAKLSFDGLPLPPGDNIADNNNSIQRKCAHCEEEENKLQRKEMSNGETVADPSTENYISSINGKGRSLTSNERKFFEPRMGYDFSAVRLQTNEDADQSAKSINALAYTHGNNIVFGSNQYQPNTDEGKKLIAHELTHVVQQGTEAKAIQRKPALDENGNAEQPITTSMELGAKPVAKPKQAPGKTPSKFEPGGFYDEYEVALEEKEKVSAEQERAEEKEVDENRDVRLMALRERLRHGFARSVLAKQLYTLPVRDLQILRRYGFKWTRWGPDRDSLVEAIDKWAASSEPNTPNPKQYGNILESEKAYYQRNYAAYQNFQQKSERVASSGPFSLTGRVIGTAIGTAIGGEKGGEKGGEWGALVGDAGDIGLAVYAGWKGRTGQGGDEPGIDRARSGKGGGEPEPIAPAFKEPAALVEQAPPREVMPAPDPWAGTGAPTLAQPAAELEPISEPTPPPQKQLVSGPTPPTQKQAANDNVVPAANDNAVPHVQDSLAATGTDGPHQPVENPTATRAMGNRGSRGGRGGGGENEGGDGGGRRGLPRGQRGGGGSRSVDPTSDERGTTRRIMTRDEAAAGGAGGTKVSLRTHFDSVLDEFIRIRRMGERPRDINQFFEDFSNWVQEHPDGHQHAKTAEEVLSWMLQWKSS